MSAAVQIGIHPDVEPPRKGLRRRSARLLAIGQIVIDGLEKSTLQRFDRRAFEVNIIVRIGEMTEEEVIPVVVGDNRRVAFVGHRLRGNVVRAEEFTGGLYRVAPGLFAGMGTMECFNLIAQLDPHA